MPVIISSKIKNSMQLIRQGQTQNKPCVQFQSKSIISSLKKKCEIIGIVYVINLRAGRQVTKNGSSTIKQFMKLLKMKKQSKDAMLFFTLSNWDNIRLTSTDQQIQKYLDDLQKLIIDLGIESPKKRFMKWVNIYCCSVKDSFELFLEKMGGKQIIDTQWKSLQEMIKKSKKFSVKSEQHTENIKKFWQKTIQQIYFSILKKEITYKKQPVKIDFARQLQIQLSKSVDKRDKILIGTQFIHGIGWMTLGILTFYTGLGAVPLASGITITGGTMIFMVKNMKRQKINTPKINENLDDSFYSVMKQKFHEQITTKLKFQIINLMMENVKIYNDKIVFEQFMDPKRGKKFDIYYFYRNRKNQNLSDTRLRIRKITYNKTRTDQKITLWVLIKQVRCLIIQKCKNPQERIPKSTNIYILGDTTKLKLQFALECYLPNEKCYYNIINESCVEMFGQYK